MTIQTLKEKHPQIAFWMDALDQSEKEVNPDKDRYGFVKAFFHSGTWQTLPTSPVKYKAFEKSLKAVLDRNPDAIRIIFCESLGGTKGKKEFELQLSDKPVNTENKHDAYLGELQDLKKTVEEIKKTPTTTEGSNVNPDLIVMQKEFEHKMTVMEINHKHRAEIEQRDRIIERLEEEVEELKEEIEEYENDIKAGEQQLGEVTSKLTEKVEKESSLSFILTKSLENAGKNLIVNHPETLGSLLNVDAQTIKDALAKDERFAKQLEERGGGDNSASSSFTESVERAPEHQRGLDDMTKLLSQLPLEQFKFVYRLITEVQNPDASINTELAAQLIGVAEQSKA